MYIIKIICDNESRSYRVHVSLSVYVLQKGNIKGSIGDPFQNCYGHAGWKSL